MSKKILFGTLFASLLTAGTALAQPVNPATARQVPTYHVMPQHRIARWTSLGEVVVGDRRGNDTLHIGRDDGRFSQLRLVVKRGYASLIGARITFANGESMFVNLRGQLRDGQAMLDLPGRGRSIRSIEFVDNERRGFGFFGRRNVALVEVLGQRTMMSPPWARL